MSEYTVNQGDTSPVILIGSSSMVTTTGWTCTLKVLDANDVELINKTITETNEANDRFRAYLTPAETTALPVETYRLFIELSNAALTPPFNVEEKHILHVEPDMDVGDIVVITRATNSFGTYEELLTTLGQMPLLKQAPSVGRRELRASLVQSYYNICLLTLDFGLTSETTSPHDFTVADLDELTATQLDILLRAQLTEADMLLGANPIEDRRRAGLLSDSVGESAHFFRTTKPIELPVYKETARVLKGAMIWTKRIGRG